MSDMTASDSQPDYPPVMDPPTDWRGTPIRTGSRVAFCNANGPGGKPIRWKIGVVQDVFADDTYGTWEWLLRMHWQEDSWAPGAGRRHASTGSRGVRTTSVIVLDGITQQKQA